MPVERCFRSMGADVHLLVVGPSDLCGYGQRRLEELDTKWSRFETDSEVNRLNEFAGEFVTVSDDTALLVRKSLLGLRMTGGHFDPTVLGALLRHGYDRDFAAIPNGTQGTDSQLVGGGHGIAMKGNQVRLPYGSGLDSGGLGKGLAADLVATEIMRAGADGVLVNVGGDIRVCGRGPDSDGFTINVEHPDLDEPFTRVGLGDGAIATSSTLARRWRHLDGDRHHIIDPFTGAPTTNDYEVSVAIAPQAWIAEVLTTAALVAGETWMSVCRAPQSEMVVVDAAMTTEATEGFAKFVGTKGLRSSLCREFPGITRNVLSSF